MAGPRSAEVEVRLLGGLEVRVGGLPAELPGRKVQALLARLARRPGEEIARATLAALLWPDRAEEQARGSLRQALAVLRRVLGEAALRSLPDAIALAPAAVSVDVADVERVERAGRAGRAADAAILGGPFLEGFPPVAEPFDDWVETERAALAAFALEAFRARLGALAEAGDPAGLALAERALALDPTFEPAYRARMRILAARGDRAAALREHARCREALARGLGLEPGPETEALRSAVATAAPEPKAASPARSPAGGPADTRGLPTLAVMPFELLSDGRETALFARGLAEDVQVELSRFRSLRLLSRDAALRAADLPPEAAGRALGADYLLQASVREGGGRLRVNARLTEAATGRQLWGERIDADLAEVLEVQERIARAVAGALALRIDEAALAAARRRPPASLDAYALWLAGMDAIRRGSREADLEGRGLFERALERDPRFARAHSGLSVSYFNDWSCTAWERWDESEAEAYRHAVEATRLDPQDHVTHCILGRILLYRRRFGEGEAHLRRALALNGNDADVLAHAAIGFAYLGSPDEGRRAGEAALGLNPFHPGWYLSCLAANHFVARRHREGMALLERAPDGYVDTRAFLAAAAAHLGEDALARDHAARFLARYREGISPAGSQADALRWVLQVNPFRRPEDQAWLVEGLGRAGLAGLGVDGPLSPAPPIGASASPARSP